MLILLYVRLEPIKAVEALSRSNKMRNMIARIANIKFCLTLLFKSR